MPTRMDDEAIGVESGNCRDGEAAGTGKDVALTPFRRTMHTQDRKRPVGDVSAVECLTVLLSAEATSGA
jgi:hypothetical protein